MLGGNKWLALQRRLALNLVLEDFYQTREKKKTSWAEKMQINRSVKARKFKNFGGISKYCRVTYRE